MNRTAPSVKHKIGLCSICGWTHDVIKPYAIEENGKTVIRSICRSCRKNSKRQVLCAVCGLKDGINLFPTTIERLIFDEENTCNIVVSLCEECKKLPHSELLKKINVPNMCDTCESRILCYTSKHDKPADSIESYKGTGSKRFQVNARSRLGWLSSALHNSMLRSI